MTDGACNATELTLVRAAVAGDCAAFGQLVERYRDAVYGLAYHHLGSFEDARDVTQERFVKAYVRLSQLREPQRFASWLRQIAANECRTWQRRNGADPEPSAAETAPSPEVDPERLAVRLTVQKALSCLTDETRLAVTLFYVDGYSHQEIAGFLDVSPGAVKTRLRDARRRLPKELMDMVEDTLKSEPLPEQFSEEVVSQALERAKNAEEGWARDDFVASCDEALRELGKAPGDAVAEQRSEVLSLLAEAETSWLGEAEAGIGRYQEALSVAQKTSDVPSQATALRGLYLAHLRHGQYDAARERAEAAIELLAGTDDHTERCLAQAARDVCELLKANWHPDEPGGYTLGVFPLERTDDGWSWLKPDGVRNVSWGCPEFTATFAHLWRLGPLLTDEREVGRRLASEFRLEDAHCGWSPDDDETLLVEAEVTSLDDTIATPAGLFQDCLRLTFAVSPVAGEYARQHVARTFAGTTHAWFAPGVGLVRITRVDQNDLTRTVVLQACSSAAGDSYFPAVSGAWWRYRWVCDWPQAAFEDRVECRGECAGTARFTSASRTVVLNDEEIKQYWLDAIEHERDGDDTDGYAHALNRLMAAHWREDRGKDRAYAEEQVALQTRRGDEWALEAAHNALADLSRDGETPLEEQGVRAARQLELARKLRLRRKEANALSALGATNRGLERYAEAAARHEAAAGTFLALGDADRCAMERSRAELARQLLTHAGSASRPSLHPGNARTTETETGPRGLSSSSMLFDAPWPPVEGGSPMTHFVTHGLSHAFPALSMRLGEVAHGALNTGVRLPGAAGCESLRSAAKLVSEDACLSDGPLHFDRCRLVEVTVESSDETDTVEPQRAELRGYWAGTMQVWFAPGVGCVRLLYAHRNGRSTDVQLTSHEIAEPSADCFPLALGNRWVYRWTDEATGVQFEDTVFVAAHVEDEWHFAFVTAATAPGG